MGMVALQGAVQHERAIPRYREFAGLRKQGLSVYEIAYRWGISTTYVYDIQRRAKLYGFFTETASS